MTHPATRQMPEGERGAAAATGEPSKTLLVGPACGNVCAAISVPRAKAAPRRKFVLRYPTLEYQHEQPSRFQRDAKPSQNLPFMRRASGSFRLIAVGPASPQTLIWLLSVNRANPSLCNYRCNKYPLPDGERDGALWLPPVEDVRRLFMLIFEG